MKEIMDKVGKADTTNIITNEKASRPLLPQEVEVRVDTFAKNSFTVVVYVTARAVMYLLDVLFGKDGWSRKIMRAEKTGEGYYVVSRIEGRTPDGEIIARDDVGEGKDIKSASSDSLKRAGTYFFPHLRALYNLPQMRIPADKLGINFKSGKDDTEGRKKEIKEAVRFKNFVVNSISFGDSPTGTFVRALSIVDEETGDVVFEYKNRNASLGPTKSPELLELKAAIIEAGVTEEQVLKDYSANYGINSLEDLVLMPSVLQKVYDRLEKTKEIRAKAAKKKTTAPAGSVNEQLKGKAKAAKEE